MISANSKFSVAIVGGGVGGLTLAIGLLELGDIVVQICEAAAKFSEIGLGVNIAPNAQRALALISPKTEKAYSDEATPNMWKSHSKSFTKVVIGAKNADEGKLVTFQLNQTGMQSVHRAKFLDSLVSHISSKRAHFKKRLIGIDQYDWDEKFTMRFKDGTTAQADCVIRADGLHSAVRKHVLGPESEFNNSHFTNTACFRAIVPKNRAVEVLGEEYAQNCHLLWGPGASIFSYPVEHGELFNIILMQFERSKWEAAEWVVPTNREELETVLKDWGTIAGQLTDLMVENNPTVWKMHDHPFCATFNKHRVIIMGDAAHATTPFQGQGARQAIEDSLTLKALLGAAKNSRQIRHAFQAFDLTRRARTQKVTATSRHSGLVYGFLAENIGSDIARMKAELDVSFRWIWNRDLEDQNQEALKLFQESMDESF